MIASFGGAIIDDNNNRIVPGSGGLVGSNDITGAGYAWIGGAGKAYYSFTPTQGSLIPAPDYPQFPLPSDPSPLPQQYPPVEQFPSDPQMPTTTQTPTTTTTPTPTTTPPVDTPPIIPEVDTIIRTIQGLFSGLLPKGLTSTPLYVYNPPQAGTSGGGSMTFPIVPILVIGAVGVGGFLIYKRMR
jgi:hypothetical protein